MWEKRKVTACLAAPRQRDSGLMSDCSSVVTVPVHSDLASATPRSRGSNQHGKLASGVDKYLNMLVKYHYCRSWIGRAPCGTSLWWQWQYNSGKTKAPAGSSRHIFTLHHFLSRSPAKLDIYCKLHLQLSLPLLPKSVAPGDLLLVFIWIQSYSFTPSPYLLPFNSICKILTEICHSQTAEPPLVSAPAAASSPVWGLVPGDWRYDGCSKAGRSWPGRHLGPALDMFTSSSHHR